MLPTRQSQFCPECHSFCLQCSRTGLNSVQREGSIWSLDRVECTQHKRPPPGSAVLSSALSRGEPVFPLEELLDSLYLIKQHKTVAGVHGELALDINLVSGLHPGAVD